MRSAKQVVRAPHAKADAQKASVHVRSHAQHREHPRGEARSVLRVRADVLYACLMAPSSPLIASSRRVVSLGVQIAKQMVRPHQFNAVTDNWLTLRVLAKFSSQFRCSWPNSADGLMSVMSGDARSCEGCTHDRADRTEGISRNSGTPRNPMNRR